MRISDWSSDVCSSDLVHESQSLIVEMQACRSRPFAAHLAPLLREAFGVDGPAWSADSLYRARSEERRVGKECVSTCRSRWSPEHKKKNKSSTTRHLNKSSSRHNTYT